VQLLNTNELAQILGVDAKTLANARSSGTGINIPYIKVGSLVRYKMSEVEKYLESNTFEHTGKYKLKQ
jgi:predicted site-specific integrase-resolvase